MSLDLSELPYPQSHPLHGASLKIDRAKIHIRDIQSEISRFWGRTPYVVTPHEDQNGDLVFKINVREDVPIALSTMIGDAIHNLRAAFDLIACEIVDIGGGSRAKAQFPVFTTPERFKVKFSDYMQGASEDAYCIVEQLQPYHGGDNEALLLIHKLDIFDKHRMIIPVGAAQQSIALKWPKGFGELAALEGQEVPDVFTGVGLIPANRQFPLKDGAVLLVIKPAAREGEDDVNQKFGLDIAFGEGQVVDGQPVVPTLEKLAQFSVGALEFIAKKVFPDAPRA